MTIFATNALANAAGWGTRGVLSYFTDSSGGSFGRVTLNAGGIQQSGLWETPRFNAPGDLYLAVGLRFSRTHDWENPAYREVAEHKILIGDPLNFPGTDRKQPGRLLVNLRGAPDPHLQAYVEGFDATGSPLLLHTAQLWPRDGLWHRVEVLLERRGGRGRLRLWLDRREVGDTEGPVGTAPFVSAQFGAYINQGSAISQYFDVASPIAADLRVDEPIVVPPPPPPPPPDYEALAKVIDTAIARERTIITAATSNINDLTALARRVRALAVK